MRTRISRARWIAIAAAGTVALAGCTAGTEAPEVRVLAECVEQADPQCRTLSPADFAELAATDGVVLLDVRTPEEYAEGHLEGALNIDVSSPDFAAQVGRLDPAATYAVYCRSGNRSLTAMEIMRELGIDAAADLDGGIGAWAQAGGDVVVGTP